MVLSIVLLSVIVTLMELLFILHVAGIPMTQPLLTFYVFNWLFTFMLSIITAVMHVQIIKSRIYDYKRNYVGFVLSVLAFILCVLLLVYAILHRLRWFG